MRVEVPSSGVWLLSVPVEPVVSPKFSFERSQEEALMLLYSGEFSHNARVQKRAGSRKRTAVAATATDASSVCSKVAESLCSCEMQSKGSNVLSFEKWYRETRE